MILIARATKYNKITTPELIKQINSENKMLKEDFLDYLQSTKKSEGTIKGYSNDLDILFVWILQNLDNKSFIDVTKREFVRFQNWLVVTNGNSPSRIRRIKSAISSLSNFVENILDDQFKGYQSAIRKIESPALQPVREKTVFEDDDVERLLKLLTDRGQYKKACLVALAMFSGRRKAELVRFKVSDFDESHLICGGALYKSDLIKTKGRNGGKFINCYVLAKDFKPYLNAWLDYRKENNIKSEWLFPDEQKPEQHMNKNLLNSWARSFSKLMDVDFYFHLCRHRFTTYLVKAGLPDSVIAEIVSWEDTSLVKVYTDIEVDEHLASYFEDGEITTKNRKGLDEL